MQKNLLDDLSGGLTPPNYEKLQNTEVQHLTNFDALWLESWPSTVHWYFDCLCVLVLSIGILTAYVSELGVFSFLLTRSLREFREFGNSGNCRAKRLCCKAKSLPRAWELLGSDIYSFVLPCSPLGIPGIWEFWEFLCEIALLQGKIISMGFGIIGKSYFHKANLCTSV